MWVKAKRQFSLSEDVQFDSRMVKEEIPREVPDDEVSAAFIDSTGGEKSEKPLLVIRDEAAAKRKLKAFVKTLEKERDAVIAKRKELAENGSYVAFEELKQTIVPEFPKFHELAVEPEKKIKPVKDVNEDEN